MNAKIRDVNSVPENLNDLLRAELYQVFVVVLRDVFDDAIQNLHESHLWSLAELLEKVLCKSKQNPQRKRPLGVFSPKVGRVEPIYKRLYEHF